MQRWSDLGQVPADLSRSVVTIGNFDGVHRGHLAVLTRVVERARERDALAVAITFDPHPRAVHRPDERHEPITDLDDRLELIAAAGVGGVLVLPYSLDFARQSPEEFVLRYVCGLRASLVVVGHDVRFGWRNAGTLDTMVELGRAHGFDVEAVDDLGTSPTPERARWSSSAVRELLHAGRVEDAQQILGRDHHVHGTVVHGDARGRTLGFPTANLGDVGGMVPGDGVYAGWLTVTDPRGPETGHRLPAAISVGTNPTFDGQARRVEAYVLDRSDLDLYGRAVRLDFVSRLRPTERFESMARLVEQMHDDVARSRAILVR